MDLADAGADACSGLDLRNLGVDEHAGHDAGVGQAANDVGQAGLLSQDIEAPFGGDLVAAFGYKHRHFRLESAGYADHFIGGGHF